MPGQYYPKFRVCAFRLCKEAIPKMASHGPRLNFNIVIFLVE